MTRDCGCGKGRKCHTKTGLTGGCMTCGGMKYELKKMRGKGEPPLIPKAANINLLKPEDFQSNMAQGEQLITGTIQNMIVEQLRERDNQGKRRVELPNYDEPGNPVRTFIEVFSDMPGFFELDVSDEEVLSRGSYYVKTPDGCWVHFGIQGKVEKFNNPRGAQAQTDAMNYYNSLKPKTIQDYFNNNWADCGVDSEEWNKMKYEAQGLLSNALTAEYQRKNQAVGFIAEFQVDPNWLTWVSRHNPSQYNDVMTAMSEQSGKSRAEIEQFMKEASYIGDDAIWFHLNRKVGNAYGSPIETYASAVSLGPEASTLIRDLKATYNLSTEELLASLRNAVKNERGMEKIMSGSGKRGGFVDLQSINWGKLQQESQQGLLDVSQKINNINLDPATNGVNAAFEKFGKNTQEAFNAVGTFIIDVARGNNTGLIEGMEKAQQIVNEQLLNTDSWLSQTLNDPETWITVIGVTASVAATILSAGTASPAAIAALNALEPSLTILNNLAQNKPVDPSLIVTLVTIILPEIREMDEFGEAILEGVEYALLAGDVYESGLIGQVLANASEMLSSNTVVNREGILKDFITKFRQNSRGSMIRGKYGQMYDGCSDEYLIMELTPRTMNMNKYETLSQVIFYLQQVSRCGINETALNEYLNQDGYKLFGTADEPVVMRIGPYPVTKISSGSGRNRKSSYSTKMSGTGNEDLAYMGIEDRYVGSGQEHSWERHYDEQQRAIANKKMELVRRRAAERTVKIKPFEERPTLLSDTFKVGNVGRNITGQLAGGASHQQFHDNMRKARNLKEEMTEPLPSKNNFTCKSSAAHLYKHFDCCDNRIIHDLLADKITRDDNDETIKQKVTDVLNKQNCVLKKGSGKKKAKILNNPKLPPSLETTDVKAEKAVLRMAKAASQALKNVGKGGRLKGGDWFKPSTWTWESVNPVNWSAEDWTNVAKGADAAIFGVLADPYILAKADKALLEGGTVTLPPPIGTIAGATLAAMLTGAVMAHEYVYPSCEKGQGVLGCNEYRAEVKKVVDTAVKIAKAVDVANSYLEQTADFITTGIGENIIAQTEDILGNYGGKKKLKGGDVTVQPSEKHKLEFFYPTFTGREARGTMGMPALPTESGPLSLSQVRMF